jgi:hypothetical protein
MRTLLKIQSITFILLLLCSVCITPVMASNMATSRYQVVEDGVHLIKSDEYPTIFDPHFYTMAVDDNFVVDGNQYYWVRIGNMVSEGLTTNSWIPIIVLCFMLFCVITPAMWWGLAIQKYRPEFHKILYTPAQVQGWKSFLKNVLLFMTPILILTMLILNEIIYGALVSGLTHIVCGEYPDLQASDGTILLNVDKVHPETNMLYMKSDINLTTLTHLASSGNILNNTGVKLT